MTNRKKLPALLYDKTTGWWFSNVRDPATKCGRAKHMWSKDRDEAQREYNTHIEEVVTEHAGMSGGSASPANCILESGLRNTSQQFVGTWGVK